MNPLLQIWKSLMELHLAIRRLIQAVHTTADSLERGAEMTTTAKIGPQSRLPQGNGSGAAPKKTGQPAKAGAGKGS